MNKDNIQNDNQMTNLNGNELALRVALCDLVQRLKRSEFMCKYLEQCRNELVSEVIKLRSHNNLLLKELLDSSNIQSIQQNLQEFNNNTTHKIEEKTNKNQIQQLHEITETDVLCNNFVKSRKTITLDSFVDESWEEITNRLINQLKKEIIESEKININEFQTLNENDNLIINISSDSNYLDLESEHESHLESIHDKGEYEVQEQHMVINDLDLDIKPLPISNENNLKNNNKNQSDNKFKMTYNILENYSLIDKNPDKELFKMIEVYESNDKIDSKKCDINKLLKNYLKTSQSNQNEKIDQLNLVQKVLHNYNIDLEEITRQIMLQNEKLVKLKGKKIKNYFRKQLDKTNDSGPNSKIKIN